ncbi:uncharacterized protein LOC127276930 [Leptopilina boulardi]|uniref:uncharacterized protein LOC127276930 n=1 Tax=Leptopilina boulardi TaxID=63433 RepID=UPI0021F6336B|nr:uncharacterized protein LOC127276930 [Leptopilina boulardi]
MSESKTMEHDLGGNQSLTGSDRQAHGVGAVTSGPWIQAGNNALLVPRIIVERIDGVPQTIGGGSLQRRGSSSSLLSVSSTVSAASMITSEIDAEAIDEERDKCVKSRAEEAQILKKMGEEVQKMIRCLDVQKNVNRTIKDGLKNLESFVAEAKKKHLEGDKCDDSLRGCLENAEENCRIRNEKRVRLQDRVIRRAIVATKKREQSPSSPEDTKRQEEKKKKESTPPGKTDVKAEEAPKLSRPKYRNATRGSTMVIRVAKGKTYADVLGKLRMEVDPDVSHTTVVGARPTKRDLLIKIRGDSDKGAFTADVAKAVGSMGKVQSSDRRVTLEIRDLDCLTQEAEVQQVLEKELGKPGSRKVTVLGPNQRGMKLAVVVTNQEEADRLEELGRIKVGFMCCPIRKRVMVVRCHRCLGYGHIGSSCKATDRSAACFKCGEAGHKFGNCKGSPSCFLCKEKFGDKASISHIAGSGACGVFRTALEEAKKALARTKNKRVSKYWHVRFA